MKAGERAVDWKWKIVQTKFCLCSVEVLKLILYFWFESHFKFY